MIRKEHVFLIFLSFFIILTACVPKSTLRIEEHAIKTMDWEGEELTFTPVEGNREDILAKHKAERMKPAQTFTLPVEIGYHTIKVTEGFSEDFDVSENITVSRAFLDIYQDDLLLMTIDAGVISPINNFRGLWAYESHWFLEVAHVEEDPSDPNAAFIIWGEIFQDGNSLNEKYGYDEAFNFQILSGKPFFFYNKGGEIGFSYDGVETDLDYAEIPHYMCCSASAFNPLAAENMVAFYASMGEQDYYVEIGAFK